MKIKFKKLHPDAKIPQYAKYGDSGFDLSSIEDVRLSPMEYKLVDTGLACQLFHGVEMQIRPRSGLAAKQGLSIVNSPGTIDSGYTGPLKVILINLGNKDINISKGDRIAQGVIVPVLYVDIEETDTLQNTERGVDGFGSSGK